MKIFRFLCHHRLHLHLSVSVYVQWSFTKQMCTLCRSRERWKAGSFPSELAAAGAKRVVRSAEGRPGPSDDNDDDDQVVDDVDDDDNDEVWGRTMGGRRGVGDLGSQTIIILVAFLFSSSFPSSSSSSFSSRDNCQVPTHQTPYFLMSLTPSPKKPMPMNREEVPSPLNGQSVAQKLNFLAVQLNR